MSKLEIKTTVLNSLFNFAATLVSVFVSVYVYVYADSLIIMSLYTMIRIGLFPPSFILGSKISKKLPFTATFLIGLILITCSLIYIICGTSLFETNRYYVLFAAVLTGIGEGFYYFSANSSNQIIPSDETRALFWSLNGLFNNVGSLLAPFVSNLLIRFSPSDLIGYRKILYLTVAVYFIVLFLALSINKKSSDKDISLMNSFSLSEKMWRDHQVAVFFFGLMNSLSLTLMGILIFRAAGNGDTYSKLQTVFALICVIAYRLVSKKINSQTIKKTYLIGLFLKVSSTCVLVLTLNMFGAIYYGIANALSLALYDNTYNILSAKIISNYKDELTNRVVARETALSIGRCVGMGFIVLCYYLIPGELYLKVSVVILSLSPLIAMKILMKYN